MGLVSKLRQTKGLFMRNHSLLILPGDGIGPEVMTEVRKVIAWLAEHRDVHFDVSEDLEIGRASCRERV